MMMLEMTVEVMMNLGIDDQLLAAMVEARIMVAETSRPPFGCGL